MVLLPLLPGQLSELISGASRSGVRATEPKAAGPPCSARPAPGPTRALAATAPQADPEPATLVLCSLCTPHPAHLSEDVRLGGHRGPDPMRVEGPTAVSASVRVSVSACTRALALLGNLGCHSVGPPCVHLESVLCGRDRQTPGAQMGWCCPRAFQAVGILSFGVHFSSIGTHGS